MVDELRFEERPKLRRPVLISAFRGWNDGGQGASLAGQFLARTWKAEQFADIDPENFFDFQVTRPHVSLVDGTSRHLDWPETSFMHAPIPGANATRCSCSGSSRTSAGGGSATLLPASPKKLGSSSS
jgi:hypothetical protein